MDAVPINPGEEFPSQSLLLDELEQRFFDAHLQDIFQLRDPVPRRGLRDHRFTGFHQGPPLGKPDVVPPPQTLRIKSRQFLKRVETTAMRITAAVAKFSQLAKNGHRGRTSQGLFQFGQGRDLLALQK